MKTMALHFAEALIILFVICALTAANAFIDKSIAWDVFLARTSLFTALAGVLYGIVRGCGR